MFATITLKSINKRFKKSFKIEKKKIGETEFLKVTLYKRISDRKLEKKLKNKVDTVILSDNLRGLNFKTINISNSDNFIKKTACYTFSDIIKLSGENANRITVCIIDKYGEYRWFVKGLVDKASVIKVITENLEDYTALSSEIYEEKGAELILTDDNEKCDIGMNLDVKKPYIWIKNTDNRIYISKDCIKLSQGISGVVPQDIYECDFANILREYKEFKRLNLISADCYEKNGYLYRVNSVNINELFAENKIESYT